MLVVPEPLAVPLREVPEGLVGVSLVKGAMVELAAV